MSLVVRVDESLRFGDRTSRIRIAGQCTRKSRRNAIDGPRVGKQPTTIDRRRRPPVFGVDAVREATGVKVAGKAESPIDRTITHARSEFLDDSAGSWRKGLASSMARVVPCLMDV